MIIEYDEASIGTSQRTNTKYIFAMSHEAERQYAGEGFASPPKDRRELDSSTKGTAGFGATYGDGDFEEA